MSNYLVQEDGSSKLLLEDSSGSLINEAAAAGSSGFADVHGVASGESESVNAESGFANIAGVAAGASVDTVTTEKAGFANVATVATGCATGAGNHVLQQDCTRNAAGVFLNLNTAPYTGAVTGDIWLQFDVAFNSTWISAVLALGSGTSHFQAFTDILPSLFGDDFEVGIQPQSGVLEWNTWSQGAGFGTAHAPTVPIVASQFYTVRVHLQAGTPLATAVVAIDGVSIGFVPTSGTAFPDFVEVDLVANGLAHAGALVFFDNFKLGTTEGGTELASDDFEGCGPSTDIWSDQVKADSTLVFDPGFTASVDPVEPPHAGRVFIAFDDGPLEAHPDWTRIDGGDLPFPQNFVSGYDVTSGRQTLLSQTDTGTATVYINDHVSGLFDPRNISSPYFGKLDGRQILLQLYDPVVAAWEDQFRGHIDEASYDIDGSAVDANGDPINASIQLDCVDLFAFLADYGLTPGLDGVTPPVGGEDGVWYATTTGTNDDRMIEILADVGVPVDMYGSPSFASGNTHVAAVKYDPDESALQALRDAADADLPFIANIFCDRHGRFQFHGRYARFDPDDVSAEPGSDWDFTRWAVGDGDAIVADSTRAQMRILQYGRGRRDVINVATAYPQGVQPADMVDEIFADTTSITAYGKHSAPPMSDLLLNPDEIQPVTGFTGKNECFHYAKLMVLNQKDPREAITALQLKAIRPDDARARATWALITKADISHIVNVAVGYPGGTGFTGASPKDDYYIEGRQLRVRPLNKTHDYVELDLEVSPAVWSMDTHGVFPAFGDTSPSAPPTAILTADFTVAV